MLVLSADGEVQDQAVGWQKSHEGAQLADTLTIYTVSEYGNFIQSDWDVLSYFFIPPAPLVASILLFQILLVEKPNRVWYLECVKTDLC